METLSTTPMFGGVQGVYRHHATTTACPMTFSVYVPPLVSDDEMPVLWFLSGLTCTHANATEKGKYQAAAAEHGLIVVVSDTSPRGRDVPDERNNWQFGQGAGFYLDATQAPFATNYRMYSYLTEELPALVAANFPADLRRQGIFGHSMGGHGALTIALKNPDRFASCSAFAPIVQPSTSGWSRPALQKYLGPDEAAWRPYDTTMLLADGYRYREFLVDQGTDDEFLQDGLKPWLLQEGCEKARIPLTLTMRQGYDHSFNFIAAFMPEHIAWHAARL